MMTQRIYYKVVRSIGHNRLILRSCTIHTPGTEVTYIVGKFVKPRIKHSKLFVFETLKYAVQFAGVTNEVYKCHIKGKPIMAKYRCSLLNPNMKLFWTNLYFSD